ncbi:hypothetical protein Ctob_006800 [Chrysochromulina tobinii]|uniref:Uncharacterized protein n=1 Tax=Chrysochromulina tobinii TaxID=1460289 RepID=A0A0M0JEP6_9EUKA|nr:hypothetical protein Ctob_006800 [Chrysochromulina tobinii]|eukprot:KOO24920.1 hypothetical protein Ctob_006800 [Chrysochromulina sp. CCMP291]
MPPVTAAGALSVLTTPIPANMPPVTAAGALSVLTTPIPANMPPETAAGALSVLTTPIPANMPPKTAAGGGGDPPMSQFGADLAALAGNGADATRAWDIGDAALAGDVAALQSAIEAGADVNSANDRGAHPLMLAAHDANVECVSLLLQSGADAHRATRKGRTALHVATTRRALWVKGHGSFIAKPPPADDAAIARIIAQFDEVIDLLESHAIDKAVAECAAAQLRGGRLPPPPQLMAPIFPPIAAFSGGAGSGNPPYKPVQEREQVAGAPGQVQVYQYCSISKMDQYQSKSFEELRGAEWGFHHDNFSGDWQLSMAATQRTLLNGRPHYVHKTKSAGQAHLFHVIDPTYHVPRWVIGPTAGGNDGWAYCESDASTPHEILGTWIAFDGFEWSSCKSLRFEPKEDQCMDPMREALAAAGVFPPLVAMLGDGTAEERAAAAEALWKLSRNDANKAAIAAAGAIVPLAALVRDGDAKGKANAAAVLGYLSIGNAANKAAIAAAGAIVPLAALVRDGDAQGKAYAAHALGNLSIGNAATTAAIAAAGAIVPLAALVRDGDAQGKAYAAHALGNLSNGNAANTAAIAAAGAIVPLAALVRDGDAQAAIAAAGAIVPLAALVRDGDAEGKRYAALALGNLSNGNAANEAAMVAAGAVESLKALMRDGDAKGKEAAARAIESQLDKWVAAKRAKDFATADRLREELRKMGVEPDCARRNVPSSMSGGGGAPRGWDYPPSSPFAPAPPAPAAAASSGFSFGGANPAPALAPAPTTSPFGAPRAAPPPPALIGSPEAATASSFGAIAPSASPPSVGEFALVSSLADEL